MQRCGGRKASWEDPVVHLLGEDWRCKRDETTWQQWKAQVPKFVADTCDRWHLTFRRDLPGQIEQGREPAAKKERLIFRGSEPDADELVDTVASKVDWGSKQSLPA